MNESNGLYILQKLRKLAKRGPAYLNSGAVRYDIMHIHIYVHTHYKHQKCANTKASSTQSRFPPTNTSLTPPSPSPIPLHSTPAKSPYHVAKCPKFPHNTAQSWRRHDINQQATISFTSRTLHHLPRNVKKTKEPWTEPGTRASPETRIIRSIGGFWQKGRGIG